MGDNSGSDKNRLVGCQVLKANLLIDVASSMILFIYVESQARKVFFEENRADINHGAGGDALISVPGRGVYTRDLSSVSATGRYVGFKEQPPIFIKPHERSPVGDPIAHMPTKGVGVAAQRIFEGFFAVHSGAGQKYGVDLASVGPAKSRLSCGGKRKILGLETI